MKSLFKFLGIIALAAVMTLSLTACDIDNEQQIPAQNRYLLNVNFDEPPYLRYQEILAGPVGTIGIGGWVNAHGGWGTREFVVVEHSANPARNAARVFATSSGHHINIGLDEPIGVGTGLYTFSFDAEISFQAPTGAGTSSYHIGFATYPIAQANALPFTGIRFFRDGRVTVNSSGTTGVSAGPRLTYELPAGTWHRIVAVIDTFLSEATWFIYSAEGTLLSGMPEEGITAPFPFYEPLSDLRIIAPGSGTIGTLHIANIRIFYGTTDMNPPAWW